MSEIVERAAEMSRGSRVPSRNALRLLRARVARLEREQRTIDEEARLHDERIRVIRIRMEQIRLEMELLNVKEAECTHRIMSASTCV